MTLPSQAARTMSPSGARFSASRGASPLRRMMGWGLLAVVVLGFGWWAVSGRRDAAAKVGDAGEESLKVASTDTANASLPEPKPEPKAEPVKPLVMGDAAKPAGPGSTTPPVSNPSESKPIPETIAASNTPGNPALGGTGGAQGGTPESTPPKNATPTGNQPTAPGSPGSGPGNAGTGAPASSSASLVSFLISQGDTLLSQGKPVEAREVLNRALNDSRATESDRSVIRDKMSAISDALTFSTKVEPGDPMTEAHALAAGENLVKLAYGRSGGPDLKIDWRLLQRINKIPDAGKLRQGQRIKIVKGPFHAVVSKSAFRMDVFADIADSEGHKIYIRSFSVGLGAEGSTPIGSFIVKPKSKMVNPKWVNPRTGEKFDAEDPKNPIGERWIGLQGTDKTTELLSGYGIHGTIDDASIGHEASMGCVRMHGPDIELVYELLSENGSTVEIRQ